MMNAGKAPTIEERVRWQEEPTESVIMYQKWRDLLFVHWSYAAEQIQTTLPAGLTVDTFDGRAWVGIVPFFMKGVRPRFLPAMPVISDFPEINVRTYVLDAEGRPGVWFYSLDCNQWLAITTARVGFYLPYWEAEMDADRDAEGTIEYRSRRRNAKATTRFRYSGQGASRTAQAGTLDFFLIERYLLFCRDPASGDIYRGRVHHPPYTLMEPKLEALDSVMLEMNGLPAPNGPPEQTHYSPGVDVSIYGLERVDPNARQEMSCAFGSRNLLARELL